MNYTSFFFWVENWREREKKKEEKTEEMFSSGIFFYV